MQLLRERRLDLLESFRVRPLQIRIPPVDDRLRPELLQILLVLFLALVREDALADLFARLFEGQCLGRRGGFELENLIPAWRPQHGTGLADFHGLDELSKIRRYISEAERAYETA